MPKNIVEYEKIYNDSITKFMQFYHDNFRIKVLKIKTGCLRHTSASIKASFTFTVVFCSVSSVPEFAMFTILFIFCALLYIKKIYFTSTGSISRLSSVLDLVTYSIKELLKTSVQTCFSFGIYRKGKTCEVRTDHS